ncbi:helix-turn-helix transcriptional regulator [Amycolatopsis sp. DSM 110486]|uniref:helix-turn-helix domain-containing protein n=1 Tax=Amycolatopsis sp. DSM 110486 TaxID=2865832 RepID=UPI001C698CF6|nr:helix-turn-helix transcriptional regulator [Amycolatopsis sp. DSM 110486]QYN20167.1 helix-turn-helix transcriptional regulator [Amycolatopsis sp. DSM 110486]
MPGNTATIKSKAVGAKLRKLRTDRRQSLRAAAADLGIDPSTLLRYETGERGPKAETVARILGHYGVNNGLYDEIMGMLADVDAPQWLAISLPEQRQQTAALLEFEAAAGTITEVAPLLIPGLVQSPDYTRAIMSGGTVPSDEVSLRVATRLGRREVVSIDRPNPANLVVLVGEAALRQVIGTKDMMVEQLDYLLKVASWPHVDVRVVPFTSGWHPALEGAFTLIDPRADDGLSIVFLENRRSGLILHEDKDVKAYREAIPLVSSAALSPAASIEFIADLVNGMRTP